MQEKKNIGKTYEGTEEYVAFFVKGYYVLVQESSLCGLDYTCLLYTSPSPRDAQ